MSLNPAAGLRRVAAAVATTVATGAATACLALPLLLASTAAQAGVVISTYTHGVDEPYEPLYRFQDGPFGLRANQFSGAGFYSSARAIDRETSNLATGPGGRAEYRDVIDDSGLVSRSAAGQVAATAWGQPAVARAMSNLFENHASAATAHQLFFWNSRTVRQGEEVHAPNTLYLQHQRTATAESAWYDTWTATGSGQVNISLALGGQLRSDPWCGGGNNCAIPLRGGTDSYRSDNPYLWLDATFIVYDLDQMLYCTDWPDECGNPDVPHPLPMSILTARYEGDGDLPIDFLHEATLGFEAIAGHRYLAMGMLSVEGQDGGVVDFFNTLRITGMDVAPGVLRSAGTGGDLADYFAQAPGVVPVPATLWLLLLGGAALVGTTRRGRR